MIDFSQYKIDELCEFINGFAFKSGDYVEKSADTLEVFRMGYIARGGGFKEDSTPVFVPKSYGKDLSKYLLRKDDVLIAMTDMKNNVAILANTARIKDEDRFVLNQRVGCLRVKDDNLLDPTFFYFYSNFKPHVEYLRSRANSGVQVNLSTSSIKEAEMLVPPLSEQKTIASVLGALDDKIENNRRMNETLEEMARAIFKSWFVDFDPVQAKASGNAPAHMDADTAALFPSSFGDDGLPAGWNENELTKYATLNSKSHNARNAPEEVWYADLANTKNGKIESFDHYLWGDAPSRAKRILQEGDTIVGTVRPGNCSFAYIGKSECPITGSTGFAVLTPTQKEFREFIYCAATSNENIDRLAHLADGAAYPAVKPNIVSETLVSISDEKLIFAFHLQTVSLLTKVITNIAENQTLTELRDTLLPKLMSGEIRVTDAEREVEAAV
jgi:type I restriction enzyme, S subunit